MKMMMEKFMKNGTPKKGQSSSGTPSKTPMKAAAATKLPKQVLKIMATALGYDRNAVKEDMCPQTAATTLGPLISVARMRSACDTRCIPNRGDHKIKALKVFQYELTALNSDDN